jgi:hypothetical protein
MASFSVPGKVVYCLLKYDFPASEHFKDTAMRLLHLPSSLLIFSLMIDFC